MEKDQWDLLKPGQSNPHEYAVDGGCTIGIEELELGDKELIKITNLLGQEVEYRPNTSLIYICSDGSTERVMKIEE